MDTHILLIAQCCITDVVIKDAGTYLTLINRLLSPLASLPIR